MTEIWFKTGEATVLAAEGQATDAMPEVLIGSVKGPVGIGFASMLGQVKGHTRMFVIRDINQLVRPATMMTTKVTIQSAEYAELLGGVVDVHSTPGQGSSFVVRIPHRRNVAPPEGERSDPAAA